MESFSKIPEAELGVWVSGSYAFVPLPSLAGGGSEEWQDHHQGSGYRHIFFIKKKSLEGWGGVSQAKSTCRFFWETQVLFPAWMWGSPQLPVTPPPEGPSSALPSVG